MEIIKLEGGSLSIHFDEIEKEILNELTKDLLVKLGNEDLQASIPVSYTHLTLPTNREV